MWYLLILLAIVLVYYIYDKNTDSRRKMLTRKFNGPKTYIFGNAYEFLNIKPTEILDKLHDYAKQYGRVYRLWFVNDFWLMFGDPKDCEIILTHPKFMNKSTDYDILAPWLGKGILLNVGPSWYSHRKVLTPAFHFSILENFVPIFEKQTLIFNGKINKMLEQGITDIDVASMFGLLTLDIICETSLNVSINAQSEECEYAENIKELTSLLMWRIFNNFAASDFIFKHFFRSKYQQQTLLIEKVHKFTNDIIEKKREEIKTPIGSEDDNDGVKKRMTLIDVLMQAKIDGELLTNQAIREELDSFCFAGHDTTSSVLSFLLYNLGMNPEAQAKAYEEIVDKLPTEEPLTLNSLNNLKYVELVIKESMRIHTTVPNIGRQLFEEVEMNGKIIPANTNITVGIYFMCHDPEYFPEPEKFKPERFDVVTSSEKSNFKYIPFSAGNRNCIGQRFAMKEITAVLVVILREFEISVVEGFSPVLTVSLVLKSENGIHLQFKKR